MKKKREILFVSSFYYPFIVGGAELSNKLLVEGINKVKHINIKVLTFGKINIIETIEKVQVNRIFINNIITKYLEKILNEKEDRKIDRVKRILYRIYNYFFSHRFKKLVNEKVKEKDYKILHTSGINLFFPEIWWKYSKKKNIKTIHTLRDPVFIFSRNVQSKNLAGIIFDKFHKYYYKNKIEKYVDYIHSPSKYMIDLHLKHGFKFKNIKIIPNTVNLSFENGNFRNKNMDIIYVGVLNENKGIRTFFKVKKLFENKAQISFIGDGPLKDEAIKLGINVSGWIEQNIVFEKIKKAKILILPSEWEEAFGRVLIEAVACGTLPIGSNRGAIPEVLFYDERYIFNAGDSEELLKKIERILNLSEEEYEKEIINLQERMKIYSYENHIKQFEEFYDEVITKGD